MLLFIVIIVTLRLATTNGFLDNCLIDREHRVDNHVVIDVLRNLHKDLSFLQVITESRQSRDYDGILQEVRNEIISAEVRQPIEDMIAALKTDQYREEQSNPQSLPWNQRRILQLKVRSYFYYFKAEMYRLFGNYTEARSQFIDATNARRIVKGVSLNALEKLNGLITIQRVSKFNHDVDKLYNLRRSPDFESLEAVHSASEDDLEPLRSIRFKEIYRIFGSASITRSLEERTIGKRKVIKDRASRSDELSCERKDPSIDDFNGHSITRTSAEAILCEFARKIAILGRSPRETSDYSSLIGQLKKLDPPFADKFYAMIQSDGGLGALGNSAVELRSIFRSPGFSSAGASDDLYLQTERYKSLETFMKYFTVEKQLRFHNNCDRWNQADREVQEIKQMRQTCKGVSLGKILELEGRVVIMLMKCFHLQVASYYKLNGNEGEHELLSRREVLGISTDILPCRLSDQIEV